jgi:hypothetical protein
VSLPYLKLRGDSFHSYPNDYSPSSYNLSFWKSLTELHINNFMSITMAIQCEVWTACARSKTGVVGSNLTWGMDVCVRLFCVCVVLCVRTGLATGWSPVQGVLPTVYRIKKLKNWSRFKGLESHRRGKKQFHKEYEIGRTWSRPVRYLLRNFSQKTCLEDVTWAI